MSYSQCLMSTHPADSVRGTSTYTSNRSTKDLASTDRIVQVDHHDSIPVQSRPCQLVLPFLPAHTPLQLDVANTELNSSEGFDSSRKVLRAHRDANVMPVAAEDISTADVIIAYRVMGPTGAGKSSFIQLLTGGQTVIGHNLEPCTTDVQLFKLQYPERPDLDVVLVDTPGLDIDEDKIIDWLKETHERHIKLAGILYLHRITDNHLTAKAFRILRMFKALCEFIAPRNITLATTMWDNVDEEIGSRRQKELDETYWKGLIDWGSKICHFHDTPDSAWDILVCLRTPSTPPFVKSASSLVVPRGPLTTDLRDYWKSLFARLIKPEDVSRQDTIIVVIGPTGSGKSTFINTLVGSDELAVGHGLASCTERVQAVRCPYPRNDGGKDLIFVDTPAFNYGADNQKEVARTINEWLTKTYTRKIKVAGIIYLHRISDVRMTEPHLKGFQKMCGDNYPGKILLVTTMWSLVDEATGLQRERELKAKYWSSMMAYGLDMVRFDDMEESAWRAVRILLESQGFRGGGL